jgi:hypothetical protein
VGEGADFLLDAAPVTGLEFCRPCIERCALLVVGLLFDPRDRGVADGSAGGFGELPRHGGVSQQGFKQVDNGVALLFGKPFAGPASGKTPLLPAGAGRGRRRGCRCGWWRRARRIKTAV